MGPKRDGGWRKRKTSSGIKNDIRPLLPSQKRYFLSSMLLRHQPKQKNRKSWKASPSIFYYKSHFFIKRFVLGICVFGLRGEFEEGVFVWDNFAGHHDGRTLFSYESLESTNNARNWPNISKTKPKVAGFIKDPQRSLISGRSLIRPLFVKDLFYITTVSFGSSF